MQFNGLSLEQAPPISAPLRFYLTAPLFAILAGVLILLSDASLLQSRYSVDAIVITHAITIGFMSFVMLGSLTQMLPVLAGVKMYRVDLITKASHLALVFGTLFMLMGLKFELALLNSLAIVLLASGFLAMIVVTLMAIKKVKNFTPTVAGMSVSLIFAFLSVLMGVFLLFSYIDIDVAIYRNIVANTHSVLAIFGFGGILIVGVTFQVLPMFYVAPKFKDFYQKRVVLFISLSLILWMITSLFFQSYSVVAKLWIVLFFASFAVIFLQKIKNRKRKISDITLLYYKTSTIFLAFGSLFWIVDEFYLSEHIVVSSILIGGFILSIMIGMLYKIVPFLIWFHLNAMGYMSIPTMNEMIDKKLAMIQFSLFVASLLGFILSYYTDAYLSLFAMAFIISMVILQYNIITAVLIYKRVKKTKPDFDMSAFA
ncbi:hypothetical protein M947_02975 [Sulfurimonas hongkongensis]|uniref:Uncharacterized protein n=1 Tax=Sulfurimonas hongkongensis TaxID=1172190 RepID=T0JP98_9BACT|nr:hypothetical protein [Sulfurimonas hongkongensis]EQB40001.1 hypothetical protein M947_02975 [Sulfurimonas hongkongensis]